ncbi:chaperonin containing TCP1, group II (cytosolic) [Monocercomonoides exilis]|uniref:chaperonin containing TCP1, group II (cytosolic) n=1 Tax=Monocercomonoides exilis TaxID=2049356 RepID=UPI003559FDE5|nr:chaperonin containing TCP1, group II (cytosolic) [Monocercomonoides exilis]|eukprot:MONOS_10056.1-p1 / transcript=MONOS_10056.1 / gene=MONOS_10056 / organism=Monocercomonoides_exilis_PA203 / gene_product=chaperonin containing TCP1, group II (cytosolic) / transcript_product=chaperonin containing TCP1, group II (cytosolic) / location=Mono_scaffold00440:42713-44651(+) / protein_length=562 / sequence_SO=supercontig / SO=protein_coding / is_pseudo=false
MATRGVPQIPFGVQPKIILLREGTDTSQGIPQLIHNINVCESLAAMIKSTLGPRGLDKMIVTQQGKSTITNDGATIVRLLNPEEPVARTLADIALSQDAEIGDGTTSVLLLATSFLKGAKSYIEEGVSPQIIIRAFHRACAEARKHMEEMKHSVQGKTKEEADDMLYKVAVTAMNSKLIAPYKKHFGEIVVGAVKSLDESLPLDMIGIKQVVGGAMEDSELVRGVAFKKTFSYAGFEQQPKKIPNPKVILLNVELELKNENTKAELHIKDPAEYQAFVDAEWKIIFKKLDQIIETGANIVLSRLAIGDLATQYFADRNIFCAGRVAQEDLERTSKALGITIQSTTNDLPASCVGTCDLFEEKQVGGERFNYFTGCPKAKTATIVLRGGATKFLEEMERSVHDAIMVVRRTIKHSAVLPGAGAIEMELSKRLRDFAITIPGKEQLIIGAYAAALEVIPRQLVENAGFDSTTVVEKLRAAHHKGEKSMGVDISEEGILDAFESCIWEPASMKINAISAATEAACLVLSIDETIKSAQSEQPGSQVRSLAAKSRGRGRGGIARM